MKPSNPTAVRQKFLRILGKVDREVDKLEEADKMRTHVYRVRTAKENAKKHKKPVCPMCGKFHQPEEPCQFL